MYDVLIDAYTLQSSGVYVELTATRRTSLTRFTFPANMTLPRVVVDITNDGQQSGTEANFQVNPRTGRVSGAWFRPPTVYV